MKSFAHHDRTGVIHSLVVVDAAEGVEAGVEPELGILVTQTDGVELGDDAENLDAVRTFLESHKVEVSQPSPGRLVDRG